MSDALVDNLTGEIMEQLLAAVGSEPTEGASQAEVTEYNWHQPHYFTAGQLEVLEGFTKDVAAAVAERFTRLFNMDFNVTTGSVTQHFAAEIAGQISETAQKEYHLAFGPDQEQPCGFVAIHEQTAGDWVKSLLGDSESQEDSGAELSQLEESLLLDIATATVEGLLASLRDYCDLRPAEAITKGQPPVDIQGTEVLCKIVLAVKQAGSEDTSEAYFLIPCRILAPVAGEPGDTDGGQSAEDVSNTILNYLQPFPVSVTAQLGTAMLTFQEIAGLRSGDILILDQPINEPIEIVMEGKTISHGRPARSAGHKAVMITEPPHRQTEETNEMVAAHAPG